MGEHMLQSFVNSILNTDVFQCQIKVHFENHPSYSPRSASAPPDEDSLEYKLFTALAEANLLVGPGTLFAAVNSVQERSQAGHLRVAFSSADVSNEDGLVSFDD